MFRNPIQQHFQNPQISNEDKHIINYKMDRYLFLVGSQQLVVVSGFEFSGCVSGGETGVEEEQLASPAVRLEGVQPRLHHWTQDGVRLRIARKLLRNLGKHS